MVKRKLVIVTISIALASFLVGTSMATYGGNPFDKIWEAINDLQSKVDSIEEHMSHARTIRLLNKTEVEVNIEHPQWLNISFTLVPENISNNVLMEFGFYFEYCKKVPHEAKLFTRMELYDKTGARILGTSSWVYHSSMNYQWSPTRLFTVSEADYWDVLPNQEQYTMKVMFNKFDSINPP